MPSGTLIARWGCMNFVGSELWAEYNELVVDAGCVYFFELWDG